MRCIGTQSLALAPELSTSIHPPDARRCLKIINSFFLHEKSTFKGTRRISSNLIPYLDYYRCQLQERPGVSRQRHVPPPSKGDVLCSGAQAFTLLFVGHRHSYKFVLITKKTVLLERHVYRLGDKGEALKDEIRFCR